jgi:hypothetical protein
MDESEERARLSVWLLGAFVGAISIFWSYAEFSYLAWGDEVQVIVQAVLKEEPSRRRRYVEHRPTFRVSYVLDDPVAGPRREFFSTTDPQSIVSGSLIQIQFIPGSQGWSRPPHRQSVMPLIVTGLGATAFVIWLVKLSNETRRYAARGAE